MDSEIQEVVYIAVTAIVLSIVLGLVSVVMNITRDMSNIRNNEVQGNINVMEYRQFNKYDHNTLNGDEVIECITNFYDTGIEILVKTDVYNLGSSDYIEEYDGEEYADAINTSSDFLRYRISDLTTGKTAKYDIDILMQNFTTDKEYRAYLVYNSLKPGLKFNDMHYSDENLTGSIEDLDKAAGFNQMANSEVTGILFIRTE